MDGENDSTNDWSRLNRDFYSSGDPAAYFAARQRLLTLYAARPDEVSQLLVGGVLYGHIHMQAEATNPDPDEEARQDRIRTAYVTTESTILLHHAAEALLRLFIGHSNFPECPWLGAQRVRTGWRFNDTVRSIAKGTYPDLRDCIRYVFLPYEDVTQPERAEGLETIERLLRELAGRLDEDRNVYNSAKHGMAVLAGDFHLSFGPTPDEQRALGSGPSLSFLEFADEGARRHWSESTTMVDIEKTLMLVDMTITTMRCLWQVALLRYTGAAIAGVHVVSREALDMVMSAAHSGGGLRRFSVEVATEHLG